MTITLRPTKSLRQIWRQVEPGENPREFKLWTSLRSETQLEPGTYEVALENEAKPGFADEGTILTIVSREQGAGGGIAGIDYPVGWKSELTSRAFGSTKTLSYGCEFESR